MPGPVKVIVNESPGERRSATMSKLFGAGAALLGLALAVSPSWGQAPRTAPNNTRSNRAYLGAFIGATEEDAAHPGAVVRQVTPDSPAATAGLQNGDVITRVDGRQVEDPQTLLNVLAQHKPGDKLKFQVERAGKEKSLEVTLGSRPARRPGEGAPGTPAPRERPTAFLGVQVVPMEELTPRLKERLGISGEKGLVVMEVLPDSPAAKAGLRHGDVITALNGQEMTDANQFRSAITKAGAGKEVRLAVMRGKEKKDLDTKLGEAPLVGFGVLPQEGFPDLGNVVPGRFVTPSQEDRRIQELQDRLQQLEKRVQQLEQQKQGTQKKPGTAKKK
jgi:predicted metalloprotease with PDZ domain